MKFAKVVFTIAGIWGLAIVVPLYFLYETFGRRFPPPLTHPDIYYGFVGVTLTWQIAFLIIARDPARLRPMVPAAVLEKFSYVAMMTVLYARGSLVFDQFAVALPDFVLGMLFVAAFARTRPSPGAQVHAGHPSSRR